MRVCVRPIVFLSVCALGFLGTLQERSLVVRIAERRLTWFEHVSGMGTEWYPAKYYIVLSMKEESNEDNRKSGWTM